MSSTSKSVAMGGSGAGRKLDPHARAGLYLRASGTALSGARQGRRHGGSAGHGYREIGRAAAAFELVIRLSKRLASLNRDYSESALSGRPMSQTDQVSTSLAPGRGASTVSIYGATRGLGDSLPLESLFIDAYPFVVGRLPHKGESAPEIGVNLTLEDSKPFRMSRVHFAILRTEEGLQVRDLESTLGTSVNGVFLGRRFGSDLASLKRGENIIAAGGVDSPFRFRVVW